MNPARFLYPTRGFLNTVAASQRIPSCLTRNARAYHADCIDAPAPVRAPGFGATKTGTNSENPGASTPRGSQFVEPPSTTTMKEKLYALQYTRR
jgi:hypothetical protein